MIWLKNRGSIRYRIFQLRLRVPRQVPGRAGSALVERFDTEFNPDFSAKSPNFRGLVLFCIEADFCTQIRILQHFSRTTRFAILCTASISKFELNFVKLFRIFAQNFAKNRYFSTFFIEFCTDFDQNFTEFRRIFQKMMSNPKNAEFPMDSSRFFLNSDRILTEF